jgi:hypothetical protein
MGYGQGNSNGGYGGGNRSYGQNGNGNQGYGQGGGNSLGGYGGSQGNSQGGNRDGNGSGQGGGNGGGRSGGGGGSSLPQGFDKDRPYTSRIEACGDFALKFTRYADVKLNDLKDDPDALLFLDWLRSRENFNGVAKDFVTIFLHKPEIAVRLDSAIQEKREKARNRS